MQHLLASMFFLAVLLPGLPGVASAQAATQGEGCEFALIGDPQVGFGPGGTLADAGRLKAVIERVNDDGLPLTIIPGDLVQDASLWQRMAFDGALSQLDRDAYLTPGNHDIDDVASLEDFRDRYGDDYYDFAVGGCGFVVIDSETARDPSLSEQDYQTQWRFIEAAFARQAAHKPQALFVVTHRPPFVEAEDEPDSGTNWPADTRKRLLALMRAHGARHILAGHLHRTVFAETSDGIRTFVLAGTARSYDVSDIGYLRVTVGADGVQKRFVKVLSAPTPPPRIPGLSGWTPRLFEFSPRHWLFTILFCGVAALSLVARRRSEPTDARLWTAVAALLVFFGLNYQIDVDELLQVVGRKLARATGVSAIRHAITASALGVAMIVAGWVALQQYRNRARSWPVTTALVALGVPALWFALSMISHHDIGMVLDESQWDLLTLLSLAAIGFCARRRA